MKFLWRVAVTAVVFNVAGMGFAIATGEPWHALTHGMLALGFGLWAQRLRASGDREAIDVQQQLEDHAATVDELRNTLANQSAQLAELQERVDFAERLLAQVRDRQALGTRKQEHD